MEGKLGRFLERVGLQEPQQRDGEDYFDYLNRRKPGMGDGLRRSMENSMEPHVAHELRGMTLVPVLDPGFRAREAARVAGEPMPPTIPLTQASIDLAQPQTSSDAPQGGMEK